MENYFVKLNDINVSGKTEKKGKLNYLSWCFAWGEIKKLHPDANYTVYESPNGWNYFTDGRTCWVKTGVTVNGIEHIEYLPVMDNMNRSITLDKVTSFDVNKTIQRSITKACARHGLGLYIYAGEDLPECEKDDLPEDEKQDKPKLQEPKKEPKKKDPPPADTLICECCGNPIIDAVRNGKVEKTAAQLMAYSWVHYQKKLCARCIIKESQKDQGAYDPAYDDVQS